MTIAAINTTAVLKTLYASLLAGVGVTVVLSIAILGAIRASDMRRVHRPGAATAYATLGLAGLGSAASIVIYGLLFVTRKS